MKYAREVCCQIPQVILSSVVYKTNRASQRYVDRYVCILHIFYVLYLDVTNLYPFNCLHTISHDQQGPYTQDAQGSYNWSRCIRS